ncbi:MAG TPA: alpha/beta fold hydrolase [Acidimicrobiales bacterium]|nr:alpha/beta fold hydrolase [Acidimicrobiales bacterium]
METWITANGLRLHGYLARPPVSTTGSPGLARALVVCHGFPAGPRGAASAAQTYPELADRIAGEAGWMVLTFNFRGAAESEGNFSLGGWLQDLKAATEHLLELAEVDRVRLAGFSTGGSLALCAAGEDERVAGVAAFAAPADFESWASDAPAFLQHAREIGVVRDEAFPEDFDRWALELHETRPLALVGKVSPRPVLLVHGAADETVPVVDARALADAAGEPVELRVLPGAGHRLRHDPRAIAVLLGWLDRQL